MVCRFTSLAGAAARCGLGDGLGRLGNFGDKGFCHGVLLVNSMVAKRRAERIRESGKRYTACG